MSARVLRPWIILAALAAMALAAVSPSPLSEGAAGTVCIVSAVLLVSMDGLRKRGASRRRR